MSGYKKSKAKKIKDGVEHSFSVTVLSKSYLRYYPDKFKGVEVNLILCKMPRASALKGCSQWNSCQSFGLSHLNCHLDLDSIPQCSKHPTVPNQRASVDTGQRVWCSGKKEKAGRNIDIQKYTTLPLHNSDCWQCLCLTKSLDLLFVVLATCHVVSQIRIELEYSDIMLVSILSSLSRKKGSFIQTKTPSGKLLQLLFISLFMSVFHIS